MREGTILNIASGSDPQGQDGGVAFQYNSNEYCESCLIICTAPPDAGEQLLYSEPMDV